MLRFYYNPKYKYTNRAIIDLTDDTNYVDKDYANIDSPDTINGHIIYQLNGVDTIPTYILDLDNTRRYFVSGITQLRSGKYQISLLRDMISEQPELWKNEEAYVNAGLATDFNKYKKWDLPYTNTKTKEQRLDINGKSSFFVFYVNTQNITGGAITEQDLNISSATIPGITGFDYQVDNLNEIPGYSDFVNNGSARYWSMSLCQLRTRLDTGNGIFGLPQYRRFAWTYDSNNSSNGGFNIGPAVNVDENNLYMGEVISWRLTDNENNARTNMRQAVINFLTQYQRSLGAEISLSQIQGLAPYVNKIIHNTTNNKVYTIRLSTSPQYFSTDLGGAALTPLIGALRNITYPQNKEPSLSQSGVPFTFLSSGTAYNYTLEELGTATGFDFNFKANTRKLPKSAVRCVNIVSDGSITDNDIAQSLMLAQTNGINSTGDTGRILDIQYLPFSVATTTNSDIKINTTPLIAEFLDNDDLQYITTLSNLTNINKETDSIKIVSPSRSSQFLFRPYNNDGRMEFRTKITLKPYTTVMYIRPSTQGLLINDWDDKDCLIIHEDFSLTNVSSEWTNYIYNNRNYQNVFNRELQGREFERGWERQIEDAQRKADNWTARNISAQKAQTYTGNLPIISSVSGAIGTAWQDSNYMEMAKLDREYNEALYQEGINISKDMFNYQLDNIKSQPAIPSKITTIDAKLMDGVYLEFYGTNHTELDAINNFYRYNGNRIDAYGTFSAYWGWFVRGKIILSQFYTQPEINELNRRLNMGIFTEVQYGN